MTMRVVTPKFGEVEGQTWILALAMYGAWCLNFVFSGYWMMAHEYLFKPVFIPVHPTGF